MLAETRKFLDRCQASVYNAPNPAMRVLSSRVPGVWCALILLAATSRAADWQTPVAQLAEEISGITGPSVVALEMSNRSSLGVGDVEEIRRALTASLANAGVRIWQVDQAAATIHITLSENLTHYVWVAKVQSGAGQPRVALVSIPRPASVTALDNVPPLTLNRTRLLSEDNPILDVALVGDNPKRLLVLGTSAISIHELKDGESSRVQSLSMQLNAPLPRDPRGRLLVHKDLEFDAYLPGVNCHGMAASGFTLSCSVSEDPWPLGGEDAGLSGFFSPARNFFTGALVPGIGRQKSAPAFYSAARIPKNNYALWVLAGVDGQLHLVDGLNQQTLPQVHWGSDIAGLHAACRSDWQVLATAVEDEPEDSIQAFAFPDHAPVAVSQKLLFKGPIRALWTTAEGDAAVAIYRSRETGNYEAVKLNLTCSH